MDNLTHSLVGLAAAKTGLEKLSPGTTTLCLLAANAPDVDIVTLFFGDRWFVLQQHRGISHSLVGTAALSIFLPLLFYAIDSIRSAWRRRPRVVKLRGLLVASVLVSATHPLLDWTNNYGIRFLLPWNPKWFYGDLVFIVDPFIWLAFGTACFLLTSRTKLQRSGWLLLGTITTLIVLAATYRNGLPDSAPLAVIWMAAIVLTLVLYFRKAAARWGRKIALSALIFLGLYWSGLASAHWIAFSHGSDRAVLLSNLNGESLVRSAAMPTAANPFRWDFVFETDKAVYRFPVSLIGNQPGDFVRYEKSPPGLAEQMAKLSNDRRVQILLGFARFPVGRLQDPDCSTQTFVQLADLRYTEPGRSRGSFALEIPVDCANSQAGPVR